MQRPWRSAVGCLLLMACSTCILHCIHDHQPPWACPQAYLVVSIFSVEVSFFQNDSSVCPVCHSTMFITVALSCVDHIHASSVPVSFPVVPFFLVVPFIHFMCVFSSILHRRKYLILVFLCLVLFC